MSAAELERTLGAKPPASVASLPADELARLTDQIATAKTRLDSEMTASVDRAIRGVPFAIRGLVKKALLG